MADYYQGLFNLMHNEHGLTLTISEMDEIISESQKVVNKISAANSSDGDVMRRFSDKARETNKQRDSDCPDCLMGRDEFEPDWKCSDCRGETYL